MLKNILMRIGIAITIAGLAALALGIAGLLWYSPESGYCVGTLAQCLKP